MLKISHNSGMKGNLLTLQQIAKMQELTQNRLSTGLKVNSAIDNPSSFYTAASLSNRANNLSALLDAMSQGIQTLKAAQTGLSMASKFLEQAKAIANKALEFTPTELSKDWYISEASKQNGVIVSNAVELKQAIADNKELIVVYGKIEINDNVSISLNANQKLVGTEYFSNINKNAIYRTPNGNRISEIKFDFNAKDMHGIILDNKALVQDLAINYTNTYHDTATGNIQGNQTAIYLNGGNLATSKSATIKNIDLNYTVGGEKDDAYSRGAINITNYANLNIEGNISIKTEGIRASGILNHNNSQLNISRDTKLNIKTDGVRSPGITNNVLSTLNLFGTVNIQTSGIEGYGISNNSYATMNLIGRANIQTSGTGGSGINNNNYSTMTLSGTANIQTSGTNGTGIFNNNSSTMNLSGNINIKLGTNGYALSNNYSTTNNNAGNCFNIYGTAKIYLESTGNNLIFNGYNGYAGADKKMIIS